MKNLCLTIIIIFISLTSFSQSKVRWGKYSENELNMQSCSFEKGAKAMVLYEDGFLRYRSKKYINSIHRRIKIFNKSEVGRGVVRISFNPLVQEIIDVEGITTSLINGNEVSSKLRDDQISTNQISKDKAELVIKMPVVRDGSIIEYRYKKQTKVVSEPSDWNFQHDIPTLYSSYRQSTDIPKEFKFYISFEGVRTLTDDIYKGIKTESGDIPTTLTRVQKGSLAPVGILVWEMKKIQSLKKNDPFLLSPQDYRERIVFRNPTNTRNVKSWDKFLINYLNKPGVLQLINGNDGEINQLLSEKNIAESSSATEKLTKIHSVIKNKYDWSGDLSLHPEEKNNSADINLRLYAALKSVFSKVNLVLLSTPANGVVYQGYPLENPFDHVVVRVIENNKTYFLDATNKYLPFTVLPVYSNGRAGLCMEEKYQWTDIKSTYNWKNSIYQQITFQGNDLKKSYNVKWDEVNTSKFRKAIALGAEDYYKQMFEIPEMRKISSHETNSLNDQKAPLNTKFAYEIAGYLQGQDKIYLNPIEYQELLQNPMKDAARYYPIQYQSLPGIQVTSIIDIPEGYEVEKLPEMLNVSLPESFGRFTYRAVSTQGKINLSIRFEILKNSVPAKYYDAVKNFYQTMADKCKESIILKKI